jgi:hypothetical protein
VSVSSAAPQPAAVAAMANTIIPEMPNRIRMSLRLSGAAPAAMTLGGGRASDASNARARPRAADFARSGLSGVASPSTAWTRRPQPCGRGGNSRVIRPRGRTSLPAAGTALKTVAVPPVAVPPVPVPPVPTPPSTEDGFGSEVT